MPLVHRPSQKSSNNMAVGGGAAPRPIDLKILRALANAVALTTRMLAELSGVQADPKKLGLVDRGLVARIVLDVDGRKEPHWEITQAGSRSLEVHDAFAGEDQPTEVETDLKVSCLVPWAGSARLSASEMGKLLDGCTFVAVPFCGGLAELPHIGARTLVVNDLHRHIINLARVAADEYMGPQLWRRLRRKVFHLEELRAAQLKAMEEPDEGAADLDLAEAYFVSQWMGRSGFSGGPKELKGGLALRWDSGGGDSNLRYRNAVLGLKTWRRILQRCSFSCDDWRDVIRRVKDQKGTGIYSDSPWPGLGDKMYKHSFTEQDHRDLALALSTYQEARVVVRYLDCELADELYPDVEWKRLRMTNRNQARKEVAEIVLVKN